MNKKTHHIYRIFFLVLGITVGIAYLYLMFKSLNEGFLGILLFVALVSLIILSNQHEILEKLSD